MKTTSIGVVFLYTFRYDTNMKNIVIIDDLKADQDRLLALLTETDPSLNVHSFFSTDQFLSSGENADILFLDIDLNGKDGIKAKKKLNPYSRFFVYTTNLKEKMHYAFGENVVGFLLKEDPDEVLKEHIHSILNRYLYTSISFRTDEGTLPFLISDIYYISRENRKIYVHLKSLAVRIYDYTLSEIYDLCFGSMIWIDRSIMVNAVHIHKTNLDNLILDNSEQLHISSTRRTQFLLDFMRKH